MLCEKYASNAPIYMLAAILAAQFIAVISKGVQSHFAAVVNNKAAGVIRLITKISVIKVTTLL